MNEVEEKYADEPWRAVQDETANTYVIEVTIEFDTRVLL